MGLEVGVPASKEVSRGSAVFIEIPDCNTAINLDGPGSKVFPLEPGTYGCIAPQGDIPHPDYMVRATGVTASPLVDTANDPGKTMVATGTGQSYDNAVAGWTARALGTTESSSQGWRAPFNANGAWWDVTRQSVAVLLWAAVTAVGGNRPLFSLAGTSVHMRFKSGGLLGVFANNIETTGSFDYRHGGTPTVHPFLIIYNRAAIRYEVLTDQERLVGTWFYASDAEKGIGIASQAPPVSRILGFDVWVGKRAEKIATLNKTLLTRLGYTLPY